MKPQLNVKSGTGKESLHKYIRSYAMILALVIICVIFQMLTKGTFLSLRNISNLSRQMAVVGVLSIGMTICLIAGNFDLSVGSVTGFLGAVSGYMLTSLNMNTGLVILITILLGALIGSWNGLWIAYAKVPAFIVTLGSSLIFKGGLYIVTQGTTIPVKNSLFLAIGQGYLPVWLGYVCFSLMVAGYILLDIKNKRMYKKIFPGQQQSLLKQITKYGMVFIGAGIFVVIMNSYEGIPIAVFIMLILIGVFSFILSKTRIGRKIYAVGGNAKASKLSGIHNERITLLAFSIMGMLAGAAGILTTARLSAATPGAALGMELDAVASSVIGGVSLAGGRGKVTNSIIGALVMASLTNGMSLLNVNSDLQYVVKGLILILAVWFDVRLRKGKNN